MNGNEISCKQLYISNCNLIKKYAEKYLIDVNWFTFPQTLVMSFLILLLKMLFELANIFIQYVYMLKWLSDMIKMPRHYGYG